MLFRLVNSNVIQNCLNYIRNVKVGEFEVKICKIKRTNPQNAYYWVLVGVIAEAKDVTPDYMHESFKRHFIGFETGRDYFGNPYLRPKSSAALSKEDFTDYLQKVILFADSEEIKIPAPEDNGLQWK